MAMLGRLWNLWEMEPLGNGTLLEERHHWWRGALCAQSLTPLPAQAPYIMLAFDNVNSQLSYTAAMSVA